MMREFLGSILSPPVFEDQEKTRRAQLAFPIAWVFVVVPILYGLLRLISMSADSRPSTLLLASLLGASLVSLFVI